MKVTGPFSIEVASGIIVACRKFGKFVPHSLLINVRIRTKRLTKVRGYWAFPNKLAKPDGWAIAETRRKADTQFEIIVAADPKTGKVCAKGIEAMRRHEPARVVLMVNDIPYREQDERMKKARLW